MAMEFPRLGLQTPPGATFDLNLRARRAIRGGLGVSIDSVVQFSRVGTAQYFGAGGVLQLSAADTPRYVNDPGTGRPAGLLVEPAAYNFLIQSNYFGDPSWIKTGISLIPAVGTGIDGRPTATLVADAGSAVGTLAQSVTISNAAGPYAFGGFLRYSASTQYVRLRWTLTGGSTPATGSAVFDLVNGLVLSYDGTTSYRITPGPFGFFRCEIGLYNTVSATGLTVQFERANAGDPAGGFHLVEAMLDSATQLGSPISTTTALGQRSNETVNLDLTSVLNPNEGTFLVEATVGGDPTTDQAILTIRDPNFSNYILVEKSHSGPAITVTSSTGAAMVMYGAPQGSLQRVAFGYQSGNWVAAKTGGGDYSNLSSAIAMPTATSTLPANLSVVDLGHAFGGSRLNGTVQRLIYFPKRLANGQIARLVN